MLIVGCGIGVRFYGLDKNNLWYHFRRFSESVKGINPIEENFVVSKSETPDLRVYRLIGRKTILIWLRDKNNNWESELRDGKPPLTKSGIELDLNQNWIKGSECKVTIYDPWQDKWKAAKIKGLRLLVPDFKRSLVIRIKI